MNNSVSIYFYHQFDQILTQHGTTWFRQAVIKENNVKITVQNRFWKTCTDKKKKKKRVLLPPQDCDFWEALVTPSLLFQDSVLMVMLPLVTGDKVLISWLVKNVAASSVFPRCVQKGKHTCQPCICYGKSSMLWKQVHGGGETLQLISDSNSSLIANS